MIRMKGRPGRPRKFSNAGLDEAGQIIISLPIPKHLRRGRGRPPGSIKVVYPGTASHSRNVGGGGATAHANYRSESMGTATEAHRDVNADVSKFGTGVDAVLSIISQVGTLQYITLDLKPVYS